MRIVHTNYCRFPTNPLADGASEQNLNSKSTTTNPDKSSKEWSGKWY